MESGQSFEAKYETFRIKEEVMEENGKGHGQSSGLDGSQMKIFYPIINVNEKIEVKDDKLYIKEEDVSDDRIYEVKENTLYIKEEIMENGQDQGQGFDQSSGLDESQMNIDGKYIRVYLMLLINKLEKNKKNQYQAKIIINYKLEIKSAVILPLRWSFSPQWETIFWRI
ncbi:hypothetical protein Avbf_09758 [Armadillidium vulgare]|nr:hypothetical protein Avbf_09758 [Armadillidium vulgare]